MEQSLKSLYSETLNLVKQYGNCLLQDSNVSEKDWKDLSSCMMHICDESLKQDTTFKTFKIFLEEIFPNLSESERLNDDFMVLKFRNEAVATHKKLTLGKRNASYQDFQDCILSKIPKKKGENDVTAVSENVNLIDPITKLRLTDPVKNLVCGHVYEKATIMQLLDTKKNIKCPIPGCVAAPKIKKKDLVPDTALKNYLERNH